MGYWIAVDLDGTLAKWHCDWDKRYTNIGKPIPRMVKRVKKWLAEGEEVKIFTARMDGYWLGKHVPVQEVRESIEQWCLKHIGVVLPVTNRKDHFMKELWDDRAIRVEKDTGRIL